MTPGERKHIRAALRLARQVGYVPIYVFDGEEKQRGAKREMTDAEVIAACDSVDDSHIHFINEVDFQVPVRAWARVILGNARDGSEVIADNSAGRDSRFDAAMSQAMGTGS